MLQEEADVDSSYRATYGTLRWTRPPSVEVSAPLVQRAEQLEAVLNAAAESDGLVRAKFGEWEEAIGVLDRGQVSPSARAFGSFSASRPSLTLRSNGLVSQSALEAAIPDSAAGSSSSSSRSPELQRATRDLRASLEDLTELRTDRDRLVAAARARSEQASIRPRLEAGAAGVGGRRQDAGEGDGEGGEAEVAVLEEMLTEELEKLGGPFERELKQNRARQEDLLDQIKVGLSRRLPLAWKCRKMSGADDAPWMLAGGSLNSNKTAPSSRPANGRRPTRRSAKPQSGRTTPLLASLTRCSATCAKASSSTPTCPAYSAS